MVSSLCYCTVWSTLSSTLVHQESGEQTERGHDSQTGSTQSAGEKARSDGSCIGQPTKEVADPLEPSCKGGEGERPSSSGVKEQTRMSPLPKEQARVTFCTTPTSPTTNSSSKPPLQVPLTLTAKLIHGDLVQGARAVPILRNSESSSNNGARMRNKSESSKLGDQEDLKRLTAELEVATFPQTLMMWKERLTNGKISTYDFSCWNSYIYLDLDIWIYSLLQMLERVRVAKSNFLHQSTSFPLMM